MENSDIYQNLYDRVNFLCQFDHSPLTVKEYGFSGIEVRGDISSITLENIVREFTGHYIEGNSLVLY